MPLKAGTIVDFENSMAEAMEKAFIKQWPVVMGDANIPASSRQMKLMFVAIAQGVTNHLKENKTSFEVEVDVTVGIAGTGTGTGTVTDIKINPDE